MVNKVKLVAEKMEDGMFQFLTYPMFVSEDPDDDRHRFTFTSPDFADFEVVGETIASTTHLAGATIARMIDAGVTAPKPSTADMVHDRGQRVVYVSVDRRVNHD
jgi:hypothetical protein